MRILILVLVLCLLGCKAKQPVAKPQPSTQATIQTIAEAKKETATIEQDFNVIKTEAVQIEPTPQAKPRIDKIVETAILGEKKAADLTVKLTQAEQNVVTITQTQEQKIVKLTKEVVELKDTKDMRNWLNQKAKNLFFISGLFIAATFATFLASFYFPAIRKIVVPLAAAAATLLVVAFVAAAISYFYLALLWIGLVAIIGLLTASGIFLYKWYKNKGITKNILNSIDKATTETEIDWKIVDNNLTKEAKEVLDKEIK